MVKARLKHCIGFLIGITTCVLSIALPVWSLAQGQETSGSEAKEIAPSTDAEQAAALERRVQKVIADCSPMVVSIYRHAKMAAEANASDREKLEWQNTPALGFGSGVIVDPQGFVLTSLHVLGDWRESNYLVWHQGKAYKAILKGADPWLDVAILKMDGMEFPATKLTSAGPASSISVGSFVVALGNLSGVSKDGSPAASFGVISNTKRTAPGASATPGASDDSPDATGLSADGRTTLHHYGTLLQTTAALELGSSGGLLVNLQGEMVGLTTSWSSLLGYERPGGFAIPVDATLLRAIALLKEGKQPGYGFLGVAPAALRSDQRQLGRSGALVANVVPGTPASAAGILMDDLIMQVDEVEIRNDVELIRCINGKGAGEVVELSLAARDVEGSRVEARKVKVALGKRPPDELRPGFAETPLGIWRGMRVEYATACSNFQQFSRALDGKTAVGVVEVAPNSLAWQAGLRPGDFLVQAAGKPLENPDQFFQVVGGEAGAVVVSLLSSDDATPKESLQRTIAAGP